MHIGRLADLAILTTQFPLSTWADTHVRYDSSGSLVKPDIGSLPVGHRGQAIVAIGGHRGGHRGQAIGDTQIVHFFRKRPALVSSYGWGGRHSAQEQA